RSAWRPLWAAHSVDDQYYFLFAHGIAYSVFAELHRPVNSSCALRNWHGRRMGIGRVVGNGNAANSSAWTVLGNFAAGVCFRLSVSGSCLLDRVSVLRLARSLRGGGAPPGPRCFSPLPWGPVSRSRLCGGLRG